jgi:DNA topoisomerase-1
VLFKGVVVVESPAKAKILGSYLGEGYKVVASYGHIRDLPSKAGSVDVDNHYSMIWQMNDKGKKQIKEIATLLAKSQNLFLATDPDREGEAISWHILESLKGKNVLKEVKVQRVVFHEITKTAIQEAFKNPKNLDMNLVNAYLARRILDYLVGFSLSPILWRKMPGARSAGRVQSVALRLIVERELEIQAFNSEEYWSIHSEFEAKNGKFHAKLYQFESKKLEKLSIKNEKQASDIKLILEKEIYSIDKVEKKIVKRNPYAPFTTSSMQQEAVRKLGFGAKKTMQVAQKLYEGISVDGTLIGLITYMRTDSTSLSKDAISESRNVITSDFGEKYLPKSPRTYKTKTKNAQEAHEAIRPTSFKRAPQKLRSALSEDEFKLYDLIWRRALASQMESAIIEQVAAEVVSNNKKHRFKATGSTVAFDGFLKVYVESKDNENDESESSKKLPNLKEKETLNLISVNNNQHYTQPPPRYNEASLVKKLEELGIGRPSTYATIISVLQVRKYVLLQKKVFIPQNIGFLTTSFLRNFFNKYVQYDFTANLEEELDDISNGKMAWEKTLDNFWEEFCKFIQKATELSITNVIDTVEHDINDFIFQNFKESRKCPICSNGEINLKLGKFGAFLGCSTYPECKFTTKIGVTNVEKDDFSQELVKNEIGTDSGRNNDKVFLKKGPYGYYFEWEKTKDVKNEKKPKRLSVPKCINDPLALTIEDVLKLDSLPLILSKKDEISLCYGRFGPFIRYGTKTIKIPEPADFLKIDLKQAKKITKETEH